MLRSQRAVSHSDGSFISGGTRSDVLTSKQGRHTGNGSASEGAGLGAGLRKSSFCIKITIIQFCFLNLGCIFVSIFHIHKCYVILYTILKI